jgi:hypothetical protein
MKNHIYVAFIIIIFFTGCKSKSLPKEFNYSDRLNMVIEDYCRKNRDHLRMYNFFSLNYEEVENKGYYYYSILPIKNNTYAYSISENSSYLPSDYIKFKDKVFFINDEKVIDIKPGLLEYLDSLKLLDSTTVKLQLGLVQPEEVELRIDVFDDSLEGVDYIICKKEPYNIRKSIRSSVYFPPDDKRFENLCE